jgi:acyl phosphate:glycerol-3-phosphate acyltransferase
VDFTAYVLVAIAAYLLGSIPTGFLVARARGVDIRQHGSGNIGATNVFRILGKPAGIFVLLADAAKGWCAVWLVAPQVAARFSGGNHAAEGTALLAGILAILGHNYTCWLRFKGGKGVATTAGVLLGWTPMGFGIALAVWLVMFAVSRYVSLASIAAAVSLPIATWAGGQPTGFIIATAALGLLAIYKHRDNIQRLLKGTEHRFGTKKPEQQAAKGSG